ncbi:uncharacterized protein LOC111026427 [Myzus persicae]|uniref:uncharacterized protein LOC111026427 n=1 Tax=Myzus persicae TaxID=13164 RepID=UPI000B93907D|nr:uncharacterized protein LOC111026427 [Myzus persicae]XP_022160221.1 uncharacterized protein LOC111026427 [Myzus persicae]XP_022160228.1 uncharacterized protein LOC111026427 [Myzus persicae]
MDKRDLTDDVTNSPDRKQPLKTTVSMPILGQRNNDENRRERRQLIGKTEEMSSLPDGGDDDDLPRPALTKSTSCYYVQQTGAQPSADCKPPRADDQ